MLPNEKPKFAQIYTTASYNKNPNYLEIAKNKEVNNSVIMALGGF